MLDPPELRIGLGCMRLSTDEDAHRATIAAAIEAEITVFDTARAYGSSERLLARSIRACGAQGRARIVTKGGMARPGGAWVPDGRAKTIRADCEASLEVLDGLEIDLFLIHSPDPRTPWRTSVRALARLVDEGLVRRVGLSNVNRQQLDEALDVAPVAAVEVALSVFDDRAIRGGVVERCEELGLAVLAHSPLGGPRRAPSLARREPLDAIARAHGVSAAEVALAWLLELSPVVIPIPGARRPQTARSAAHAATVRLDEREHAELGRAAGARRPARGRSRARSRADVVLVMGIPGAGKSRLAHRYVEQGFVRLNRDERGGRLSEIATALDERLAAGAPQVVLDNTYLTRASRSYVIDAAARHGAGVRCIWLDTPLAQAQVNMVQRLLDLFGRLPMPDELRSRARTVEGLMAPTSQMRALRELEPPSIEEGFAGVEVVAFEREPRSGRSGVFVAAAAVRKLGSVQIVAGGAPTLIFDWVPGGEASELEPLTRLLGADAATALCPHPGGPPVCWCRPPLPGLLLEFAHVHGLDPSSSVLIGVSSAHRTLAATVGARFVAPLP